MLRILLAALLFIIPLCSDEQGQSTSAVTYKFGGGRFGDQMLTYLHAKWAAYCYKLDFYYKPFTFSDRFVLHDEDPIYTKEIAGTFDGGDQNGSVQRS